MLRRMEDQIRKLCAQILVTKDDDELMAIVVELRNSLRQHIEGLRMRLADYPLVVERRVQPEILPLDIPNTLKENRSAITATAIRIPHQSPTAILPVFDSGDG
jgi:hypothetical protein